MDKLLYSIHELAPILDLHPKTILRFIHEGKIRAQKIGRTWKVSQEDLKAYAHAELASPAKPESPTSHEPLETRMRVSAVIEISEQDSDEASRLSNALMAALNCKDPAWGPSRYDFVYHPEIRKARYILYGSPLFIAEIMKLVSALN